MAILLFARLSLATKTAIENSVYFYRVISLHYIMYMLEHNFACVFEESARLDMFRIYHRARQNMAFECRFCDAPMEFVSDTHMHESSFRLSSHAIYMRLSIISVIVYYRLIIADIDTTLFLQWFYKFVTLLFPRAVFFSCIKQSSLLN